MKFGRTECCPSSLLKVEFRTLIIKISVQHHTFLKFIKLNNCNKIIITTFTSKRDVKTYIFKCNHAYLNNISNVSKLFYQAIGMDKVLTLLYDY